MATQWKKVEGEQALQKINVLAMNFDVFFVAKTLKFIAKFFFNDGFSDEYLFVAKNGVAEI